MEILQTAVHEAWILPWQLVLSAISLKEGDEKFERTMLPLDLSIVASSSVLEKKCVVQL